jgi:outer membrane protein TolC
MNHLLKYRLFKIVLTIALFCITVIGNTQSIQKLSIEKAYEEARKNYPLIKQKELIQRASFLTLENIKTSYLPQFNLAAQATYQSEVTSIPISLPGFHIDPLSKDQYKLWAEVNQLLFDGGINKTQQQVQQINALIDDQKIEVELYKLKDRINQLYLGILLLDAQLQQTLLIKKDLDLGIKTVSAQVDNGTAFRSAKLVVEAQLLQNEQRIIELKSNKKALIDVLGLFMNQTLPEDIQLEIPVTTEVNMDSTIARPEIRLYNFQDSLWKVQNKVINAKNNPKAILFAQGGYGKPGLNQLSNEFSLYSLGGIKLNWSLSGLYTSKREKQIIAVNEKINDVQKDLFLFNTHTQLAQQWDEIKKIKKLVAVDEQLIDIRTKIKEASLAQLQNGVITSSDYLREVNAEDQSRINRINHQLQLLQAKINYQNIKGNQ